jgi:hypothetical protein
VVVVSEISKILKAQSTTNKQQPTLQEASQMESQTPDISATVIRLPNSNR